MVAFAFREVKFYREALSKARLRPEDIRTTDDLALIPLIGKAELEVNPGPGPAGPNASVLNAPIQRHTRPVASVRPK